MSEHITHIAVYEDCANMIKYSGDRFTKAFHQSLDQAFDSGLFCSGSRGNHLFAVPILEKNRNIYKEGKANQEHLEQIAGALGWITHRAADLQMKPVFDQVDKQDNPLLTKDESQMYHDAEIFRKVYRGGKMSSRSDFSLLTEATLEENMQSSPASKYLDVETAENLFTHFLMAEILKTNVFVDKETSIDIITEKMISQSQDLYEDIRMYIRAYQSPEPFKQQGYINNYNVFDIKDPLIEFVMYAKEYGKAHPSINLNQAIQQGRSQSHYAQALVKGFDFLAAASDFFDEKLEKSNLYDSLGIYPQEHRI